MFPSSSASASGIPSARVYLGLVVRSFGREARAPGENGVNISVMATHERRMRPPLESVSTFEVGRRWPTPSVLGLGLVGSDIVEGGTWGRGWMKCWKDVGIFFRSRCTFANLRAAARFHLGSEVRLHLASMWFQAPITFRVTTGLKLTTKITAGSVTLCYRQSLPLLFQETVVTSRMFLDNRIHVPYKQPATRSPTLNSTYSSPRLSSVHHGTRLLQAFRCRQKRLRGGYQEGLQEDGGHLI